MRFLVALGAAALVGCAGPVTLDRYRGAFTTHFDGVPDEAQVCAIVTNHGEDPVEWVRLRLRSWSAFDAEPALWTSFWIYRAHLEPGASAAISLADVPVAEEIELELRSSGSGPTPPAGRLASAAVECSDDSLRAALAKGERDRTAEGRALFAADRRGDPGDVFVAQGEAAPPASR